jgi:putative membrane protein
MAHAYWNDWYFGWGWMLWMGFIILMFSGLGNWGYTYKAAGPKGCARHSR